MEEQIKAKLEELRTGLQADGGDLELVKIEGKVVYLNMIDSPEADCRALDSEIREVVANGQYIPLDSTSLEQGRVSMLFYVDNEHIKQMLMYTPPPKTSLIQIGCYANYHMLSTEKFKGGKEAAKQD